MSECESEVRIGKLEDLTGIVVIIDAKYAISGARHNLDPF